MEPEWRCRGRRRRRRRQGVPGEIAIADEDGLLGSGG